MMWRRRWSPARCRPSSIEDAVAGFGEEATAELIYLVGLYCMVSTTLNGFNVPLPEGEDS